jgi:lambda repressor-like predicted transcriptional regulator/Mor family transcriptional regulator
LGTWTDRRRGTVKGAPTRFLRGHAQVVKQREQRAKLPEPNPSGLCICGCGQPTPIARQTDTAAGWVKGKPIPYIQFHGARPLTARQEAEACRLYQSGETCDEVGAHFGVSREAISRLLKRRGIELRPRGWSTRGHSTALSPEQEIDICTRYAAGETGYDLAAAFGVSNVTVYSVLNRHGVKRRPDSYNNGYFSGIQEQVICERYLGGESTGTLSADYKVTRHTIWRVLKRNGVEIRPVKETGSKYHCDHEFFDVIDSEEKAYWLGFIAADGNVREDRLAISLAPIDQEHLYRLKYSLKSTHPVSEYTSYSKYHERDTTTAVLNIGSAKLARGLAAHGVHPRKTLTVAWPTHLEEHLLRHYLRGIVDGDGSLWARTSPNAITGKLETSYGFSLTSNSTLLTGCQEYLIRSCQLGRTKLYHKKGTNPDIVTLRYGGRRQVERIFRLMYDDASIFLLRKYYALSVHFQGAYSSEPRSELVSLDIQSTARIMKAEGLGVVALSRKMGVNRNTVANLLSGKNRARPATLERLATALGVESSELVGAP